MSVDRQTIKVLLPTVESLTGCFTRWLELVDCSVMDLSLFVPVATTF